LTLKFKNIQTKKTISNIINNKKLDFSKFNNISDYILKQSGFTSGSDNEDPSFGVVDIIKDEEMNSESENENEEKEKYKKKKTKSKEEEDDNMQNKIKLVELGPKMNLSIHKIEEGFLKGNVVFHSLMKKSKKEIKVLIDKIKEKKKIKKERRMEQEANIEQKKRRDDG